MTKNLEHSRYLLIIAFIIATLVLGACSSDDDSGTGKNQGPFLMILGGIFEDFWRGYLFRHFVGANSLTRTTFGVIDEVDFRVIWAICPVGHRVFRYFVYVGTSLYLLVPYGD